MHASIPTAQVDFGLSWGLASTWHYSVFTEWLWWTCTLALPYHSTINVVLLRIRPHRSSTYIDATYCYRPSSVVCLLVGRSVGLSRSWTL